MLPVFADERRGAATLWRCGREIIEATPRSSADSFGRSTITARESTIKIQFGLNVRNIGDVRLQVHR